VKENGFSLGYIGTPMAVPDNAPSSFQRFMMSIFSYMIEEIMEVFMDDFSVYGKTFDDFLENMDKALQRCEEKHLVLNWQKCHFMVRKGIVLGHLISKYGKLKACIILKHNL
jgi:hypothetical protein